MSVNNRLNRAQGKIMSNHFEFIPGDEKVIAPGRTVKRIRAIVAITALGITPGSVGGYVEKSENLSGNAWG